MILLAIVALQAAVLVWINRAALAANRDGLRRWTFDPANDALRRDRLSLRCSEALMRTDRSVRGPVG